MSEHPQFWASQTQVLPLLKFTLVRVSLMSLRYSLTSPSTPRTQEMCSRKNCARMSFYSTYSEKGRCRYVVIPSLTRPTLTCFTIPKSLLLPVLICQCRRLNFTTSWWLPSLNLKAPVSLLHVSCKSAILLGEISYKKNNTFLSPLISIKTC